MTRALSLTCLALWVLASPAHAGPAKPSIAVLGLEVTDLKGAPTPTDTQVAKELTEGLRSRAKAGTGPYQLQPGSEKELIDEKLLKNCDNEAIPCMVQIANDLGAEVLMYGTIQKHDNAAYDVTIYLLDVRTQRKPKPFIGQIPASQSQGAQIQGWAKRIYNNLTGQADSGVVIVKLNVNDGGTILIDGHEKGSIVGGTGQTNVAPGKHTLTVQVGGYRDWSRDINVTEGQTTNVGADLEKPERPDECTGPGCTKIVTPPGGGGSKGNATWKYVALGGTAVGLIGGGLWVYGYAKIRDAEDQLCKGGANPEVAGCLTDAAAMANGSYRDTNARNDLNSQGHTGRTFTEVGIGVAIAGALTIGYAAIVMRKSGGNGNEHAENGHRVRRDRFVVTPVVAPNGGGATLRIDF